MKATTAGVALRRGAVLVPLLIVVLLIVDLRRPPDRQLTAAMAIRAIHLYQRAFAVRLSRLAGSDCRFAPSCSRYAEAAIRHYGLLSGGGRSLVRIVRCGPWTPHGTVDLPFEGYRMATAAPE
ncbi:MAG: membrane protein insertion efficiency factor YidD [Acidobacteriota bacterium]